MRADATAERVRDLLVALGRSATAGDRLYLTGGASAVLVGWRASTHDVDVSIEGDEDTLLRAISQLKDKLDVNVELASPLDFLPATPDWRERSVHVGRFGALDVYHIAFALQALSKLQRGFDGDRADVEQMLSRGLTSADEIAGALTSIAERLYRFPSVDSQRLTAAVRSLTAE